jgi:hypothetical protein
MTPQYGPPIPAERLRALARTDCVAYRHVEAVMQRMMDELAAERRSLFS